MKDMICGWVCAVGLVAAVLVFGAGVIAVCLYCGVWALISLVLVAGGIWGAANLGHEEEDETED